MCAAKMRVLMLLPLFFTMSVPFVPPDMKTLLTYKLYHDSNHRSSGYVVSDAKRKESDPCLQHYYCRTFGEEVRMHKLFCGFGFYNLKVNSTTYEDCLPCPAGKYCFGGIKDCQAGYYCMENALPKQPWPGYYAPYSRHITFITFLDEKNVDLWLGIYAGMTEPLECPVGTYQNHTQYIKWNWRPIMQCTPCPEYMYCDRTKLISPAGYCDDGWYCEVNETVNRPVGKYCRAGEYCIQGKKSPCEPGSYQPFEYMHTCIPCPEGQYCADKGQIEPTGVFEEGWYTLIGYIRSYYCKSGSFCTGGLKTPCGYGFFTYTDSSIKCRPCLPHRQCNAIGINSYGTYCRCCTMNAMDGDNCPLDNPSPCDKGSYEENGSCRLCPEGMYCKRNGLFTPSGRCIEGWYCEEGESFPTPPGKLCPAGHKCTTGIPEACRSVVRTEEPHLGLVEYYYQPIRGETKCVLCPDRFNCTEPALTAAVSQCEPGYYCIQGLMLECEPRNYCYKGKSRPCPAGFTNYQSGLDYCERCEDGIICIEGQKLACPKHHVCVNGLSYYCELGFLCSFINGEYIKTPCLPGTERYILDSGECVPCRKMRYCRSATTYECFRYHLGHICESGFDKPYLVVSTPGFHSVMTLTNHTRGYRFEKCYISTYMPTYIGRRCWACRPGFYCGEEGLIEPSGPCYAGYYCPIYSKVPTRYSCEAGHFCPTQSTKMTECKVGTYQPEARAASCFPCTAGYFCGTPGALQPNMTCPSGMRCPEGSSKPIPCEDNTHQPDQVKASCICNAGYYCETVDAVICPINHYCIEGSSEPLPCIDNTYQPDQGRTNCICSSGYYCENTDENPIICPGGHYCNNGSVLPCLSGYYQSTTGQVQCLPCPENFYCNSQEAYLEKQSGENAVTHGVVIPKACPFIIYCAPGSKEATCDGDNFVSGAVDVSVSCDPMCGKLMMPYGTLKFIAVCDDCEDGTTSYEWSIRQCDSHSIEDCNNCDARVTYMTAYAGNSMRFNWRDPSYNHQNWTYYGAFVKVTLGNGNAGMAYHIWNYIDEVKIQCTTLPVTGIALMTKFAISCSKPELAENVHYTCAMYYSHTAVGDMIVYKGNSTCNQRGVVLRQGDKTQDYWLHLKVVGRYLGNMLWDEPLLLQVKLPPMLGTFIRDKIGLVTSSLTSTRNEKQFFESIQKLHSISYLLNAHEEGEVDTGDKDDGSVELAEEIRKENMQIRDKLVETISQIDTTTVEIMKSVAIALNLVTQKKDEISPETKERSIEIYSAYAEQFQQMEENITDEEVTGTAMTLLIGVASIIDLVTDEDVGFEAQPAENSTQSGAENDIPQHPTQAPVISEKELTRQKVKEKTVKLMKKMQDIAEIVMKRHLVDSEPMLIETPIMSISLGKVSTSKLSGKEIKLENSENDTATSLTMPDNLDLSDVGKSVGIEFLYMKKNPYVWAKNSNQVKPPIISVSLKASDNTEVMIANLSTPIKINLAFAGGKNTVSITVPLTLKKSAGTVTLVPGLERPGAATFEFPIQQNIVTTFLLSLPNELTSLRLGIRLDNKHDLVDLIDSGFRYPDDLDLIHRLYGSLLDEDATIFDNPTAYCETCLDESCGTLKTCKGIFAQCLYYCSKVMPSNTRSIWTDVASYIDDPTLYCQVCNDRCCQANNNCTGDFHNCVFLCNNILKLSEATDCEAMMFVEVVGHGIIDNATLYCQVCYDTCCSNPINCSSIYDNCVYYCHNKLNQNITLQCSQYIESNRSEVSEPREQCQICHDNCCLNPDNCTGIYSNCVYECRNIMNEQITKSCDENFLIMSEQSIDNVTRYCENCARFCCDVSENCTGMYNNCLYICSSYISENKTYECAASTANGVRQIYIFPRNSNIKANKTSYTMYFGLSLDLTDARVMEDLKRLDATCLGNELQRSCTVEMDVNVSLRVSTIDCCYWDSYQQTWSSEGIQVSNKSNGDSLHCASNHLTAFSKSVFVVPVLVNPLDVALFLTFFDNPVVVTVVIIVWMIYFFLVHWARRSDNADHEKVEVIHCADNVYTHSYTYLVCIVTGWWSQAGTTANVYIYLQGTNENSPRKCLKTSVRKCFQTGFEDWFVVTTEHSLGDLESVTLWHDNAGTSPHWYVNQLYIKDIQRNCSWTFMYNDWLAVDRGSLLLTTATIVATSEEEIKSKQKHRLMDRSTQDLRDGHIWVSIFCKPAHSTFTKVQRLTCGLAILLTAMLTNIMFYGLPTDDVEDQLTAGAFKISLSQIVIGFETGLLMFPVNMLIIQMFLRVKRKPKKTSVHESHSETSKHNLVAEKYIDKTYYRCMGSGGVDLGNKDLVHNASRMFRNLSEVFGVEERFNALMKEKQSSRTSELSLLRSQSTETPEKKDGKIFPWWCIYVAWGISMTICLLTSYLVMLYGLKYGYNRSVEWLVSFLTGFLQSVFVQQPLKVLGVAFLLTLILNKRKEFDADMENIEHDEDEQFSQSVSIQPPETHQLVMKPLPRRVLSTIRDRIKVEWLMDVALMDMLLHTLYLAVVMYMVHGHRNIGQVYQNTVTIRNMFASPADGFHVEEVSTREDFYSYLKKTVIPAMSDVTSNERETEIGSNHYLVGTYRLRQLRIKQEFCIPILVDFLPSSCKGNYWLTNEDDSSYNGSWNRPLLDDDQSSGPWYHSTASDLQTLPYPGTRATYSGGGYVVDLPANVSLHQDIFSNLSESGWIDGNTRAVFIEFTIYNPNVDLFTVALYLFEFTGIGGVFPVHHEFTSSLYHYSIDYKIFTAICEVLFVCFTIAFIYIEIKRLKKLGKCEYLSEFWTYIEIIQIVLSLAILGLFVKRIFAVDSVMQKFRETDGTSFVNFYSAILWDFAFSYVTAALIGLITMKSLKLLRYNQRIHIISGTLHHVRAPLLASLMMFAVVTIAFAHSSYLIFGRNMENYKSFGDSWIAIIIVMLGEGDNEELQDSHRFIGPLFVVMITMLCTYGMVVLMTTILNIGRLETKYKLMKLKDKFELLKYVISKVKLVLNVT